ncbi:23343_t:CDS:2 [Dentiscutata erythropus]|uniref:23343_t:CDS:1 n=1 Tax=Dentiscutata erythropus TaxID=1348616 RepID=A0A9N9EJP4_9GLOM|nr:23343_t:CDS:2 [Dentiscutata erythropus]
MSTSKDSDKLSENPDMIAFLQDIRKSSKKVVKIEIDKDSYKQEVILDIELSFSKIRSKLLDLYKQNPNERICLYNNMFFVDKAGSHISKDQESEHKLKQYRLEYELKWRIDTTTEIMHGRNLNVNIGVSSKLFFSLSASIKISGKKSKENTNHRQISDTNDIRLNMQAKVKITCKEVILSLNFEQDVEDALKCSDTNKQIDKIHDICKKYGDFWAQEIFLGGKTHISQTVTIKKKSKQRNYNANESNINESKTTYTYIGEDTNKAYSNPEAWNKSLKNPANWGVIKCHNKVSIFEILGDERCKEILKILGKNFLYAKIDQNIFSTFASNQRYYLHSFDIPKNINLKDCQIFATIIKDFKNLEGIKSQLVSSKTFQITPKICNEHDYNKTYHIITNTIRCDSLKKDPLKMEISTVKRIMSVVDWSKLTISELKDLCISCSLSSGENKEELGKRLYAYFDVKRGKASNADIGNGEGYEGPDEIDERDWRNGKFIYLDGDDIDIKSQETNSKIRDELANHLQGKERIESVPVDVFLSALEIIEKKMNRNFVVLHKEMQEDELLDEAWLKVRLSKHVISTKGNSSIRDNIETRAITLRLANNRGWSTALQIVGNNNKMMEKYKNQIAVVGQLGPPLHFFDNSYNVREETENLPFVEGMVIVPQIALEQSHAIIVEASVTSPPIVYLQASRALINPKMKTDYT